MSDSSAPGNDKACMEEILQSETVGHLAMTCDGELYLVPLNYTYSRDRILFHCALEGKKLDMIRRNPEVCLEVSRQEGRPAAHAGELCSAPFESVICWGTARVIDDVEERRKVLDEFQARYCEYPKAREPISSERAARCGAIEITVTRMTGRKREGKEKHAWRWEA